MVKYFGVFKALVVSNDPNIDTIAEMWISSIFDNFNRTETVEFLKEVKSNRTEAEVSKVDLKRTELIYTKVHFLHNLP